MAKKTNKKTKLGRKQLLLGEKKIGVSLYIKEKIVEKYGGREGIKEEIEKRTGNFDEL